MAYGYLDPRAAHVHPPRAEAEARRISGLVSAAGAVVSIAMVLGLGVWSYRLMVRDIAGVPVVRALEGPMRVSPAEPGGRQAAYQGLAVNSIAAQDDAAGAARQIALAPRSVDITEADVLRQVPQAAPVTAPPSVTPSVNDAVNAALAEALAGEAVDAAFTPVTLSPDELVPLGTPGIARSPLPLRRPAGLTGAGARAAVAPGGSGDPLAEAALRDIATRLSSPNVTEIDPTSLTAGTRLVQLGAYETEDEARLAWADLAARFPGYLDGRARVVEAATAGGRVFWRLRAHGFRDEPEARRFCSVFLAEDHECTPVLIR